MTSAAVFAPYADASARYRLIEPARVLGIPVVDDIRDLWNVETIILNRPFGARGHHPAGDVASKVEAWTAEGRRVVIDMDDDFDAIPPGHALHGKVNTEGLHRACKAASAVVCATPALEKRYGYGHGTVVRNMIPESYLSITRKVDDDPETARVERPAWVGWYGALGAHPHDLDVTGGAIGPVLREHGAELAFAGPPGDATAVGRKLGTGPTNAIHVLGTYSLDGLMRAVAEFTVGLVPLELSEFNAAKSWLKGLEMAAVGVPVIASPTPEYVRAWEQDGCRLATDPLAWGACLRTLLRSPGYRAEHAARGRGWAEDWTFERNAEAWSTAWYGA